MDTDRPEFDQAARVTIRRALLAYMEQHRSGTPALAKRISDANRASRHGVTLAGLDVSYKTLQRFLAGDMRTNDQFVGWCAKFAEGLPVSDPIGDLGAGLVSFYGSGITIQGNFQSDHYLYSQLEAVSAAGFSRVWQKSRLGGGCEGALIQTGDVNFVAFLRDRLTGYFFTQTFVAHGISDNPALSPDALQGRVHMLVDLDNVLFERVFNDR